MKPGMSHQISAICAGLLLCASGAALRAQAEAAASDASLQQVLQTSFVAKGPVDLSRLQQDTVQKRCSAAKSGALAPSEAADIEREQLQTVVLPASGKLLGDWRNGEKIAQEGRGLQSSDKLDGARGGNCYACHQLGRQEVAFGTLGPSLQGYGKLRGSGDEVLRYTYGKIYNSNAYRACSIMPRFGHQHILSPEEIADLVALLLDPQSPVNQ